MSNLYTGKGDKGMTTFFGSAEQYPKSALRVESLGVIDELNAYLGLCKVYAKTFAQHPIADTTLAQLLEMVQQHLFIIQAEIGGAGERMTEAKIAELEASIAALEKKLPPITTFFLAGGTELAAHLDVARTIARCAERRLVSFRHDAAMTGAEKGQPSGYTLAYVNRLSSLLYALTRHVNHCAGEKEVAPSYQ